MSRRLELINGKCYTPSQIVDIVQHPELDNMFQALWHNYLMKASATTSAAYWSDRFDDNKAFNTALYHLSQAGWIITNVIPGRNWGTIQLDSRKLLQWVSEDQLLAIRTEFKFMSYMMVGTTSTEAHKTKTPKGIMDVGITRRGIAKSGNSNFKYDTKYITKYFEGIVLNTTKSIRAAAEKHNLTIDGADYESVSRSIVEMHMYSEDKIMTMGDSLSDSRGRAISSSLSKVFNPIGYKDARALIVGPATSLGFSGYGQVYLFIAELLGCKTETIESKKAYGKLAYEGRSVHNLDLTNEDDLADLHENIWLERLYDNLDCYDGSNWTVPIEIDATASVIQIEGALLNDYNMCDETNVLNADSLKDVWSKGMPRKQFKLASTPLLYGSTQDCTTLWKKKKIKYTAEQVKLHGNELASGVLGLANDFKDYIIANVTPKPVMKVKIWNEEFTINCNKYRNLGDYMKKYPVYDSASGNVLTINHTHTSRIPDLEQFKRYFITLLVHNLDSQVMDSTVEVLSWSIPIYDAVIVMPNEAMTARTKYASKIDDINSDRTEILANYFDSIGIKQTNGAAKQWKKLQDKITPIKNFKCELTALK
jgi:hypothetical protein